MAVTFKDTTPNEGPIRSATIIDPPQDAISMLGPDELLEQLRRKHPEYDENVDLWKQMGDFAFKRVRTTGEKQEYLVKGDAEEKAHFDQRAEIVPFKPETPNMVSDFIGAVFSKSAQRTWQEDVKKKDADGKLVTITVEEDVAPDEKVKRGLVRTKVEEYIDDAGPERQPLTRISEMAAEKAIVYGSVDAFLDHGTEGSKIPDTILYTPEDRLDWQLGEGGLYKWVKYLEESTEQVDFDGSRMSVKSYRIIRAGEDGAKPTVQLFKVTQEDGKDPVIEVNEPLEVNFDSIPVRTLKWADGTPWVLSLVEGDIDVLRMESDLRWDIFMHAHPWILAHLHGENDSDGKGPLDKIKLGSSWATHLFPGDPDRNPESIEYLAPMMASLEFQAEEIARAREGIKIAANSAQSSEQATPSQPESGVALAYRQAQRSKDFIRLARALQEWEWQLLELVAGETANLTKILTVKYPDSFDQRLVPELAEDLEVSNEIGSETLTKEVKKELAVKLVGAGESQATIQIIMEEIDNAVVDENKDDEDGAAADVKTGSAA